MLEQSIPARDGTARPEPPEPADSPLRRAAASAGDTDTRYAAGVTLAAVLGSTLLGVNGGHRRAATRETV